MGKQLLQGGLTYVGLAIAAVAYGLDKLELTEPVCSIVAVPGCNSTVAAGVVVGLAVAVYGRIRRELRPDPVPPTQ